MRLSSSALVLVALPFAVARTSFLQQTSNNTWILGNDIWNITQGPIYGTKLYYQGKDAIGSAAGHYVGAGMNGFFSLNQDDDSDMLQMEKTIWFGSQQAS
jgi:hypothetical protein